MFKKITKLFLIFLVYLFLNKGAFAFEFVKATENSLTINYIGGYTNHLQANIFKEGDIYKGIFVINRPPETYYSLGYFESVNGIDWQMKKEILNIGVDLSNPSIIKTQTGYLLFISKFDNNAVYKIYSSICDFDFNCSRNLVPVIIPNLNNNSEKHGVFAGHPFTQGGRTYIFFGAWGFDGFKIKLAYSEDLVTWTRCPNDKSFLPDGDGPFPYSEGNNLYLFFHRSDSSGIKLAKSILPLTCDSIFEDQGFLLTPDKSYDLGHLIFPSVLNDIGGLKLYYSGLGDDNRWYFNLACTTGQGCLGSKDLKIPIIIIPGFMVSWNKDSIIHNIDKPQSDWKLNPIVNEFKGIINTLKNLGYEENKNLFIFAYDWRKPVLNIINDLNSFINNKFPTTDFQIIGHSLGGLVSRIYLQKYNNPNINKLITVGSPHRGATVSYKIVEAGEIEKFNDYLWLAVKMIVTLNKNSSETNKQTLNRLIPVMKDLFPVYNFLKKDGVEINFSDLQIKNELLSNESYKTNQSNLSKLTTIVGEKGNTLKGFNVENQTVIDKLLGNYPDGRPQSSFSEIGDYTVLSTSARINTPVILNLEHGELIYKKEAINKILDLLNIQHKDSDIVEGAGTIIDSSIIFLIKSPATMEAIYNGQTYSEQDGMIFIENAQSGDYQLKVKGNETGNYQVLIGQIGKNIDIWDNIYGETTALKTDDYYIHYKNDSPESYFETIRDVPALFDDLINYLQLNKKNSPIIKKLFNAKSFYQRNKKSLIKEILKSVKLEIVKNKDFTALEKLENIEYKLSSKKGRKVKLSEINDLEKKLNKFKKPVNQVVLEEIIKRLDILKSKETFDFEVLIDSIDKLLKIL